jgi:hypothetical protein
MRELENLVVGDSNIDIEDYLYLVSLLNLKVSYAFMFSYSMRDKLKTICMFFLMI